MNIKKYKIHFIRFLFLPIFFFIYSGCSISLSPKTTNSEWNLPIYEINIRQFSPEGSFNAVTEKLQEIRNLGVGIIWLMPVHPIGEKNRKGTLGSYYSVKDYYGVNREFGTAEELKRLIEKAHLLGMKVIIDWVANHTSWDNPMINKNPDWYTHDSSGNIIPPVPDWSDVADLNYDNPELHAYMADAMLYWIKNFNLDGFRCDVAEMVPLSFWRETIKLLREEKEIFMLAEGENPEPHEAGFNMTYSWKIYHAMNEAALRKNKTTEVFRLLEKEQKYFPDNALRMRFITNHDENSWNGTVYERYGEAVPAFSVWYLTIPGVPLVYSGQEYGLKKRLRFFDKDTVKGGDSVLHNIYAKILRLRKSSPALKEGDLGAIGTTPPGVVSFSRTAGNDTVWIMINLTEDEVELPNNGTIAIHGKDIFSGKIISREVKKVFFWRRMVIKLYETEIRKKQTAIREQIRQKIVELT